MAIWLLKTEPTVYSYDDLVKDGSTMWDGVTQGHALQNLRQIAKGDIALIYHTGDERAVVGISEVIRGFYVNPEYDDPKLAVCDVQAKSRLKNALTLKQIKGCEALKDWDMVRLMRLSVVPVSDEQWELLKQMFEATI